MAAQKAARPLTPRLNRSADGLRCCVGERRPRSLSPKCGAFRVDVRREPSHADGAARGTQARRGCATPMRARCPRMVRLGLTMRVSTGDLRQQVRWMARGRSANCAPLAQAPRAKAHATLRKRRGRRRRTRCRRCAVRGAPRQCARERRLVVKGCGTRCGFDSVCTRCAFVAQW